MRAQRATLTRNVHEHGYLGFIRVHGQLLLNANILHGVCTVSLSSLSRLFFVAYWSFLLLFYNWF